MFSEMLCSMLLVGSVSPYALIVLRMYVCMYHMAESCVDIAVNCVCVF
jgi:hypothetical protein